MNIGLTEFWINNSPRPLSNCSNFSILSNWYVNFSSCYYGNGKVFRHQSGVNKYQLSCIVVEDTFYLDFSAAHLKDNILQQMWILKHTTGIEYKLKMKCLWEFFNLPTIEQLNAFAKVKVKQPVIPEPLPQAELNYRNAIARIQVSTGLTESDLIRRVTFSSIDEHIDYITSFIHEGLTQDEIVHFATIIYEYHRGARQVVLEQLEPEVIYPF